MVGSKTGHFRGPLVVSNLLVEDSALRISSDDKVVKQRFVTVMGLQEL